MNPCPHHLSQLPQYRYSKHGASLSSTHFRLCHGSSGGLSEEGDKAVTMTRMIEQHKKWMMEEGTPLQFQHNNLWSQKEEYVTIQGRREEEYVTIQVEPGAPQMQGVAAQSSFNHSGPMADSESGIMSYAVLVEPDAPQMQGVAAQSSFNHSGPMANSESGIMSYAVLIILVVAEVILGLDFFGVI